MNVRGPKRIRVLAIDPSSRGFSFAVLEGSDFLVDWGGRVARLAKNRVCVRKIRELIDQYRPEVIVVEDYAGEASRRCARVRRLIRSIKRLANKEGIRACAYSRAAVRKTFEPEGARTKLEIANVIASWFPELSSIVPRPRKPWMSEDQRMDIFDAISFGLTFFRSKQKRKKRAA